MMKWLKSLFPSQKENQEQIASTKSAILNEKQETLNSLKQLNKKIKFTIESGQIEVVINDITEIGKGK